MCVAIRGCAMQDWKPVVFRKSTARRDNTNGNHDTLKRKKRTEEQIRLHKIENEELKLTTVPLSTRTIIQQARQTQKLTQTALAQKLNVKASVVNDYEIGKAVPDNQLLGKMEKVLKVRLRGKSRGTSITC